MHHHSMAMDVSESGFTTKKPLMTATGLRWSVISYWHALSVRLRLTWLCFGLFLLLQVFSRILAFVYTESTLGALAFIFISCVSGGILLGLHLSYSNNKNSFRYDRFMDWTKPLTSGIQHIYLPPSNGTVVKWRQMNGITEDYAEVRNELMSFVQLISRDFIHSWYDVYIEGDDHFLTDIETLLRNLFTEILLRLKKINKDLLLMNALHEIQKHLIILEKSKNNLRKLKRSNSTEVHHLLVTCYETFSVLHPAAMSHDLELDYLRSALGFIMNCVLPKNVKVCEPAILLVREIVCQAVLKNVVDLICDPDFINDAIVVIASYGDTASGDESDYASGFKGENKINKRDDANVELNHNHIHTTPVVNRPSSSQDRAVSAEEFSVKNVTENYSLDGTNDPQASPEFAPSLSKSEETFGYDSDEVGKVSSFDIKQEDENLFDVSNKQELDESSPIYKYPPDTQTLEDQLESENDSSTKDDMVVNESERTKHINSGLSNSKSEIQRATTFSGLSCFIPVPLQKRSKSPTFSALSKSVDSIVDLIEAMPGELLSERKGHSRNLSFPSISFDLESDDELQSDKMGEDEADYPQDTPLEEESILHVDLAVKGILDEGGEYLLCNLTITGTEHMHEQNSKKTFVLYVIEYAIHVPRDEDDDLIIELQVKRRYREFLTLHWKLEQHSDIKKSLKRVKDVPKRFALPIMKKDTAGIKQRRIMLEKYLGQLLDIPKVNASQEMADFLAFNGNGHVSFVRNSTSYAPKIDKILRSSISGMKQGLKNLTPFPSKPDLKLDKSKTRVPSRSGGYEDDSLSADQLFRVCTIADQSELRLTDIMPLLIEDALSGLELVVEALQDISDPVNSEKYRRKNKDNASIFNIHERREFTQEEVDSPDLVLFSYIMGVVGVLQQKPDHWIFEENVQQLMRNTVGDLVQRFVQREISTLLSPKSWAAYLYLIREAIWPDGTLFRPSEDVLSPKQKEELFQKAENILLTAYPSILNLVIGKNNMESAITQLLEVVQIKQLNKHLIYTFVDHVLELALPEVRHD